MLQACGSSRGIAVLATLIVSTIAGGGVALAEPPPPGAQPGQCFGRVRYPDHVDVAHTRVLVRRGGWFQRKSPPESRTIASRVLARPARTVVIEVPARYRSVARIVTSPGAPRLVTVPARFRMVRTRVEVEPSHLVWVRRSGVPQFADVLPGQTELTPTGEVLCRVRAPARYATRTRRVFVSAAHRIEVEGRPVRREVRERVLIAPARTITQARPAIYQTVYRTVVVRPARTVWISSPAVWRDVVRERRIARTGWAQVVCATGLAPWAMQRLQSGLADQGYDAGPSDGQARPQTYEALRRFQRDRGLAEGPVTVESARALGVVP